MKKLSAIVISSIAMFISCISLGQESTYATLKSFHYKSIPTYMGGEQTWTATFNDNGSVELKYERGSEDYKEHGMYTKKEKTLKGEEAKAFREQAVDCVKKAGVLGWKSSYVDPHCLDGTMWNARFEFGNEKKVYSGGSNDWPNKFSEFRTILDTIDSIVNPE